MSYGSATTGPRGLSCTAWCHDLAQESKRLCNDLEKYVSELPVSRREAREILQQSIKLWRAMEEVEHALGGQRAGLAITLVTDYCLICELRLEEVQHLITALQETLPMEIEITLKKRQIRRLFKSSKFSLLGHDIESLRITLDLYISLLEGRQQASTSKNNVVENRLRREVEVDLEDRQLSEVIGSLLQDVSEIQIDTANDPRHVQEQEQLQELNVKENPGEAFRAANDPKAVSTNSATKSSSNRPQSGSAIGLFKHAHSGSQSSLLDLMDDEKFSHAIRVFVQTQLVQQKTLKFADGTLQTEAGGSWAEEDSVTKRLSSHSRTNVAPVEESIYQQRRSFQNSHRTVPQSGLTWPESNSADRYDDNMSSTQSERPGDVEFRHLIINEIHDISGGARTVLKQPLVLKNQARYHEILLEALCEVYDYNAPARVWNDVSQESKSFYAHIYCPPTSTMSLRDSNSGYTAFLAHNFSTYVTEFAQWYTDRLRLKALEARQYRYRIRFGPQETHTVRSSAPTSLQGVTIELSYTAPKLLDECMVKLKAIGLHLKTQEWTFANSGPYMEDLKTLCQWKDYEFSKQAKQGGFDLSSEPKRNRIQ